MDRKKVHWGPITIIFYEVYKSKLRRFNATHNLDDKKLN